MRDGKKSSYLHRKFQIYSIEARLNLIGLDTSQHTLSSDLHRFARFKYESPLDLHLISNQDEAFIKPVFVFFRKRTLMRPP